MRAFGQALWREKAPYYRYAETVNACAMLDTTVKRALSGAWDLAYCWLEEEPGRHHLPMPRAVVGALACLALLQGWPCAFSKKGYTMSLNKEKKSLDLRNDKFFYYFWCKK